MERDNVANGLGIPTYTGSFPNPLNGVKHGVFGIHLLDLDNIWRLSEKAPEIKAMIEKRGYDKTYKDGGISALDLMIQSLGNRVVGDAVITAGGRTVNIALGLVPHLAKRFIIPEEIIENTKVKDENEEDVYEDGKVKLKDPKSPEMRKYKMHLKQSQLALSNTVGLIPLAKKINAQVVGFGGFTSVITKDCMKLIDNELVASGEISVTSGGNLTTGGTYRSTITACRELGIEPSENNICICGATGAIGRPLTRLLAEKFDKVYIISNSQPELKKMAKELSTVNHKVIPSSDNRPYAIKNSKVVVIVTSATDFSQLKFEPKDLQDGSLLIDVGRPRTTPKNIDVARPGVFAIEGGIYDFDNGIITPKGILGMGENKNGNPTVFACFLETVLLCLAGLKVNWSMGRSNKFRVEEILKICDYYGFKLSGYRMFDKRIPDSEQRIAYVRQFNIT